MTARLNDTLTTQSITSPSDQVSENATLQEITKKLYLSKMESLEEELKLEAHFLRNRQDRLHLLRSLIREMNAEADEQGNLDIQNSKSIQELLKRIPEFHEQIETRKVQLFQINESLEIETDDKKRSISQKQKKALYDEIQEIQELLQTIEPLTKEKKLTKERKDVLIENKRLMTEDITTLNQMQLSNISRLNDKNNHTLSMAKLISKTMHEAALATTRGIKG